MEKTHKYDTIDLLLLEILQERGETNRTKLAEETGLSVPAVSERIKKLEERGVIARYTAVVNAKELGYDVTAFVFVIVDTSTHYHDFLKRAKAEPHILECHAITGEGTYILKVRTQNTGTLEKFLSNIQSWKGVHGTRTSVVLSSPIESMAVPVEHLRK